MNLTQIVLAKIKKLGATKAAAYFGVSVPTIYSWKSKKNPPVSAAQKVLDEDSGTTETLIEKPSKAQKKLAEESVTQVTHVPNKSPDNGALIAIVNRFNAQFAHVNEGLKALTNAILRGDARELRFWAMKSTDPDQNVPVTSSVNPFRNPESGMAVKSAPEILGDAPVPVNLPKNDDWNKPENPAGERAPNWNQPVAPVDNKNRDADWNRPVETDKK